MTSRVVGHLKHRLRIIKKEISDLESRTRASKESVKIAEDEMFAFKVEAAAIQHALGEWSSDSMEN